MVLWRDAANFMSLTIPALASSLAVERPSDEDIVGSIGAIAGDLPQIDLSYERDIRTLWITLKPEPKPVFTLSIIASVRKVQGAIMRRWSAVDEAPILFLAYRASGSVFSLGGDLDFYLDCLVQNDRTGLADYARLAADVIRLNATALDGAAITLANIHGRALGGGIDPARACNVLVGEEGATFSYPEITFNHFPIAAVAILSRHAGAPEAERILLSGEEYSAAEFCAKGVLDAVAPDGKGEEWIRSYAGRNAGSQRARVALIAAFNRRAGNLEQDLAEAARMWVDHIMSLTPLEISKLQRIAQLQERMLGRALRRERAAPKAVAASEVSTPA